MGDWATYECGGCGYRARVKAGAPAISCSKCGTDDWSYVPGTEGDGYITTDMF